MIRIEDEFQIPSSIPELITTIYKLIFTVRKIYTKHLQKILASFGILSTPQSDELTEEMIADYMDLKEEGADDPSGAKQNNLGRRPRYIQRFESGDIIKTTTRSV